ncbi:hypothetical protein RF11_15370 [Thelohanellus kitauei]|uniref:Uncharacterized protein n=1 Tax=Thelohanellus kitauei TaxID=669202 RepID=A0A0C2I556_THEKT|nr:hypothetical protein RF11_15370 [Thelohanellus kitauei]
MTGVKVKSLTFNETVISVAHNTINFQFKIFSATTQWSMSELYELSHKVYADVTETSLDQRLDICGIQRLKRSLLHKTWCKLWQCVGTAFPHSVWKTAFTSQRRYG